MLYMLKHDQLSFLVWTIKVVIFKETWVKVNAVELHLSGLMECWAIQINGFFFKSMLRWQFEVEKNFYKQLL